VRCRSTKREQVSAFFPLPLTFPAFFLPSLACCLQNDYKTLDPTFMESVWWVFKQLFDKGLVYRGFKVWSAGARAGMCVCVFAVM